MSLAVVVWDGQGRERVEVASLAEAVRVCRRRGRRGTVITARRRLARIEPDGRVWHWGGEGWRPGVPASLSRPGRSKKTRRGRAADVRCGVACRTAEGPECDCVCGGEYHGADVPALVGAAG